MTTRRSRSVSEAHSHWRSTTQMEPPTIASLPSLDEEVSHHRSLDEWGNTMKKKQETTIRIAFQNVGGFAQAEDMDVKLEALWRFVTEQQINILGFSESNTCWDVLEELQRLARQTRGWWENCQWVLAHNRTEENNTPFQPGGTGILCINQVTHRALRPGEDPSSLGRWCWTRLRGGNGFVLRIILLYQPCFSNGPLSTYQQHLRRLAQMRRFECPWDTILHDLSREMWEWQDEGNHLIVLTDFNDDVMAASVH